MNEVHAEALRRKSVRIWVISKKYHLTTICSQHPQSFFSQQCFWFAH